MEYPTTFETVSPAQLKAEIDAAKIKPCHVVWVSEEEANRLLQATFDALALKYPSQQSDSPSL